MEGIFLATSQTIAAADDLSRISPYKDGVAAFTSAMGTICLALLLIVAAKRMCGINGMK